MRVIIAGSRDITDRQFVFDHLDRILGAHIENPWLVEVVSGGARGVDTLGEEYAKKWKLGLKVFPAKWDEHGKSAGYKRNVEMAEYATHLVVFWDGQSRGTKHMIDIARERDMPTRIVRTDQ